MKFLQMVIYMLEETYLLRQQSAEIEYVLIGKLLTMTVWVQSHIFRFWEVG